MELYAGVGDSAFISRMGLFLPSEAWWDELILSYEEKVASGSLYAIDYDHLDFICFQAMV